MKVAVVILNYNGREYLARFLPDVIAHTPDAEVIVADNHSSDDSVNFLLTNFPEIRLISLPENLGYAGGYNAALSQVEADYFVLLNSDVEVTAGWLTPLIDLMEKDPQIGACQPKILDFGKKDSFEYAGAAGGFIDLLGYPFCRGRIFTTLEEDYGQYDDDLQVFWASGACFLLRSDAFFRAGGFDSDFFAHMEEIDLCWRMQNMGYKIFYSGKSSVYHVGGATLPKSNPFKTYLNFRNSYASLIKNSTYAELAYKFPMRFVLDTVAGLKFLLSGYVTDFMAVIKADVYIILHLKKIVGKRKNPVKRISQLTGIYGKLIVLSYYLLDKRYFFSLKSIIPNRIISSS